VTALRLTWMLRRAADARAFLLSATAYALVTALLLITLSGGWAFLSWTDELAGAYQMLASVALVVLVVPLAYLGAAAARLSARAQDRRLSTLRLVGATGAQVSGVTVLGAAGEALVGAVAGAGLATALTPLVGLVPFRGAPLGANLWMPAWFVACVVATVVLLAAVSAVAGLRRVLVTPLGVRTRNAVPVPSWIRLVLAFGLVVAGIGVTNSTSAVSAVLGTAGVFVAILGAFLAVLVAINALGPWVLKIWAGRRAARATKPQALLAARTVLDDPQATWRQVSGAAMAGVVAVLGGVGAALSQGIPGDASASDVMLGADILRGVIVTLVIAFAGVAGTALVSQAATVLDREELGRALDAMGIPARFTASARVAGLLLPLILVLLVGIGATAVIVFPLAGLALIASPTTVAIVLLACCAGVLSVWGAARLAGRVARPGAAARMPAL
jgi:hypothetical protein